MGIHAVFMTLRQKTVYFATNANKDFMPYIYLYTLKICVTVSYFNIYFPVLYICCTQIKIQMSNWPSQCSCLSETEGNKWVKVREGGEEGAGGFAASCTRVGAEKRALNAGFVHASGVV